MGIAETVVLCVASLFIAGYLLLLYTYTHWFQKLKSFKLSAARPLTSFTVVIPARNEALNIGNCLQSIFNGSYPEALFEVIVVDDYSDDGTPSVVAAWTLRHPNVRGVALKDYVQNPLNAYKKKAIEIAVAESKHDWIVTTDADCVLPPEWLHYYDNFIQLNDACFVGAPVLFKSGKGFLSIFQQLDFITLQGITAASVSAGFHSMCNGANLAYRKDVFQAVGGFAGIDAVASGDDMLLMHKISTAYPGKTGYLFSRNAVAETKAETSLKSFFNQRIRWASKSTFYSDKKVKNVLIFVYAVNLLLTGLFCASFFHHHLWYYFLVFLALKAAVEFIFLVFVTSFFKKRALLPYFFVLQPFHIIYTVAAGFFGLMGSYSWKGRTVK